MLSQQQVLFRTLFCMFGFSSKDLNEKPVLWAQSVDVVRHQIQERFCFSTIPLLSLWYVGRWTPPHCCILHVTKVSERHLSEMGHGNQFTSNWNGPASPILAKEGLKMSLYGCLFMSYGPFICWALSCTAVFCPKIMLQWIVEYMYIWIYIYILSYSVCNQWGVSSCDAFLGNGPSRKGEIHISCMWTTWMEIRCCEINTQRQIPFLF